MGIARGLGRLARDGMGRVEVAVGIKVGRRSYQRTESSLRCMAQTITLPSRKSGLNGER
jgi:stalled ribosome rescue protein Dom34